MRPYVLLAAALAAARDVSAQNTFDWSKLEPSTSLDWAPCNSGFQCARLSVPFDYAAPSAGSAAIAVIRFPAKVAPSDPAYLGPVLFNPGGPGGSGVQTLVGVAPLFANAIGENFDWVSFDPRGVGFTTPTVSIFGSATETALWNAGAWPVSLNASSDSTALTRIWGLAQIEGQVAAQRDSTGILKYLTTDNVARDMLSITQKMGFDKLKYYGISYGSVLGATFAALFPDKIDRMVIDGVVDVDAWFQANLTILSTSTDAAFNAFSAGCAAAGPSGCAFARSSSTAEQISDRITALTNAIRKQPVPVVTSMGYLLIDYSLLRSIIFEALYSPYDSFPLLADALADLEKGNGTTLYTLVAQPLYQCGDNTSVADSEADVEFAVSCGDAVEVNDTLDELEAFYATAARVSQFSEFLIGRTRVVCSGWKVYREDRFKGPAKAANTSWPILFIANTADPVTPKAGALNTLANFPGSVLLTQDSPGHTSLAATSFCTLGYLAGYLANGSLPQPGTTCAVNETLFADNSNTTSGIATKLGRRASDSETEDVRQSMKSARQRLRRVLGRTKF
ncbi:AB hydrolase-1 domain-containing protein [Mycena indigotica]|uniref:AB hydrolase-1 domain-containing protein n=1 Tax=Mycena indigotica TaxID=2126181 RepID=A0A8H6SR79_9AGAR|nr:AB hydrolase-1 domain-containing protein [Mycena indigotica]KAF7304011.1 AB hydrolase-1 domain-containing protein [Mycena indigotica]